MEQTMLRSILEAMIFVAEDPLTLTHMADALADDGVARADIETALEALQKTTADDAQRGLQLVAVGGGYQFRTKENLAAWLKRLSVPKATKLSPASLETLAIVAYRQPIMRQDVEKIRGVDCGGVLKTLLEKNLVRIVGKSDEAGQPLLYGTTQIFLETFSFNHLQDLPPLTEIRELMERRRVETEGAPILEKRAGDDEEFEDDFEDDDDDEETEVIDDDADDDALDELDSRMKALKNLEKDIFPATEGKGGEDATETLQERPAGASTNRRDVGEGISTSENVSEARTADEAPSDDALESPDRTV